MLTETGLLKYMYTCQSEWNRMKSSFSKPDQHLQKILLRFESLLDVNTQSDTNVIRCSVHALKFHLLVKTVYINQSEFPIIIIKAYPDCLSALIKSWFYNHSLIWQNHHSSNLKTTSVQCIQLSLHGPKSPTEEVRGSRMSRIISETVHNAAVSDKL